MFEHVLAHWLTTQLSLVNGGTALAPSTSWRSVSLSSVSFRTFSGFTGFFMLGSCSRANMQCEILTQAQARVEPFEQLDGVIIRNLDGSAKTDGQADHWLTTGGVATAGAP